MRIAAVQAALLRARVFAMRNLGSTALSAVYVACGRVGAFYSGVAKRDCPKPWDWAAVAAIGEAAGVSFRRFDGDAADPDDVFDFRAPSGLCCASSPQLADALVNAIRSALQPNTATAAETVEVATPALETAVFGIG
jgi:fructose-1,6-bisphosphatase/inositol monophosphatase family enzyme